MRIYYPDFIDLHVYPYWKPVLDAIAGAGNPAPDCPRTLELLEPLDPRRPLAALRRAGPRRDRARVREGRPRGARLTVRVGVVGGGLIAQAEHLPYLSALRDRFQLVALAEPSATVREALGARYGIAGLYDDYRSMLDAGGLDAVVVCSPAGTHAAAVLAALDTGLHVFVEKPMCITLADADAIIAARDRTGSVVQVGTMKRYDPAVEAMLDALPDTAADLRYVNVVVNDPEFEPYFEPGEIVRGADVPTDVIEATARTRPEQVEQAVGSGDPTTSSAFSESFLGSLLHDLNVVHGMLERLGEPLPAQVVAGDWWNEGRAVYGALRLANGARGDRAWIQLLDTFEYRETISILFAD